MSTTRVTISLHLTPVEKRKIGAAVRKRGLSPTAYIKTVALESTTPCAPKDLKLERLAKLVHQVREAVEDELDYRTAVAAWDRHVRSGEKLIKSKDVWRVLGIR